MRIMATVEVKRVTKLHLNQFTITLNLGTKFAIHRKMKMEMILHKLSAIAGSKELPRIRIPILGKSHSSPLTIVPSLAKLRNPPAATGWKITKHKRHG